MRSTIVQVVKNDELDALDQVRYPEARDMKLKFHPPDEKEYARDLCIVSYRYLCVGSDLALDWFG